MGDALGDRMKGYEAAFRHVLPWRMPVIIRVDGRAFHTWTKGLAFPHDARFCAAMELVATNLMYEVQGAELAYIQSDEISLLVHPYRRHESMPWCGNELPKLLSLTAAVASSTMTAESAHLFGRIKPAQFDSRAFVLPEAEVCNYFIWRQQDATRNSIQSLAHSLYSHKQLHKKNTSELQEMTHAKGHNWNDLPTSRKRGRCVVRGFSNGERPLITDYEIPIFSRDRQYVECHLATESEAA